MSQILQHLYYRWIIMSKYIQLYQTAGYGMIIEMCRNGSASFVTSRMLQGSKEMNIHIPWNYHDTCGMLATSLFNTST